MPGEPSGMREVGAREGYEPDFLGIEVPLPSRVVDDPALIELPYTHFTVLLDPVRRLAAATAVGIDGALLQDLPRTGITWQLDPRVPADVQTGEAVYARNDLDRGHLVRRRDPTWGATRAEAEQANRDTFHYTNAAPQAARFNQGASLWSGLEDYLLANAATYERRLVVLTGPVLAPGDPAYRGVLIPLRFWKVAAFVLAQDDGAPGLAATGYVLDQSPRLPDTPAVAAGEPPPLGPFRTFQVPITDIVALTGLDLGPLARVDGYTPPAPADRPRVAAPRPTWTPLLSLGQIVHRSHQLRTSPPT